LIPPRPRGAVGRHHRLCRPDDPHRDPGRGRRDRQPGQGRRRQRGGHPAAV